MLEARVRRVFSARNRIPSSREITGAVHYDMPLTHIVVLARKTPAIIIIVIAINIHKFQQ